LYTAGSPVLTVEGTFGEAVLLETLALSILNHDSAVAAAAALIVESADGRPVIEMGSRRTDPAAAVAAARAAYLVGFATTSNLEAGRTYGIPTAGTSAHAFTLLYADEREAFAAQVAALGPSTTLLVDTYDPQQGIRNAVAVAGSALGAVRIDSGDLVSEAHRARRLLDELGATSTRVIVTGDLDDRVLRALAHAPIDGYGVGTNVVTGLGSPTAGFVYKMVATGGRLGEGQRPVAKRSPGKATVGGRKWAWRIRAVRPPEHFDGPPPRYDRPVCADLLTFDPEPPIGPARSLQRRFVEGGKVVDPVDLEQARGWHARVRRELDQGEPLISFRSSS
jgi:nicotinate phosphoribosyltransferase